MDRNMVTDANTIVVLFGGTITGGVVGYVVRGFTHRLQVTQEDIGRFMAKVVNLEEADERFNLTRKMLMKAGRRTMPRFDSGAPAKVSTMKKRRKGSRRRADSSSEND